MRPSLTPKYPKRDYCKAKAYATWAHRPLGLVRLYVQRGGSGSVGFCGLAFKVSGLESDCSAVALWAPLKVL